ncbi:spiralin lipoprotein [Spiroplasma citri]|uniref:Spiralin n=1 Tax=Spiroplasma citri TaxID=2133 RepID=C5I790_SPICI|nr:spiralin lipoprotein [Spiroplasma citri]ACQ82559.1 spiralin [Spiroplasma citri]ACQ82560.1 spiralin [Spiroplasma citri]AFJ00060.1 spriralin [Spiroplasma citri]AKN01757.1 spiralin [Spiroplasma citri]UYR20747.1 spiralin [Spiroplasma citri]
MKKLLSILAVLGVSAVGTTSVVACNKTESNNLSIVNTIAAPATVATANPKQVTKAEIKTALEANVLQAVQGVVKTATADDFQFDVYQDNKGESLTTINLEGGNVEVYVQITPAKDKTVVIGKSGYIKVTLPKIKVDISGVAVTDQIVEITAADPTNVTKDELNAVNTYATLVSAVLDAIKNKAPNAGASASDFEITNDCNEGDYSTQKNVKVTVKAKDKSPNISGEFKFIAKVKAINKKVTPAG